jgi:ribose 5-phosphate isomerase B
MLNIPIVIAADHAGVDLKVGLKAVLEALGHDVLDLGTHDAASVDYPDFANAMAAALKSGPATRGVLICGTGIGISIAANRHAHIRAAVCWNRESAGLARSHNDANVLAIGARLIPPDLAQEILKVFLDTPFESGRHVRRIAKLSRCGLVSKS